MPHANQLLTEITHTQSQIAGLKRKVRSFYFQVLLQTHPCPHCDGPLVMEAEGRCCCQVCGRALDPTATFQSCSTCGGKPRLRVRRYECATCGTEIASRFLFDGLAFDADYFRQKMAAHHAPARTTIEATFFLFAKALPLPNGQAPGS